MRLTAQRSAADGGSGGGEEEGEGRGRERRRHPHAKSALDSGRQESAGRSRAVWRGGWRVARRRDPPPPAHAGCCDQAGDRGGQGAPRPWEPRPTRGSRLGMCSARGIRYRGHAQAVAVTQPPWPRLSRPAGGSRIRPFPLPLLPATCTRSHSRGETVAVRVPTHRSRGQQRATPISGTFPSERGSTTRPSPGRLGSALRTAATARIRIRHQRHAAPPAGGRNAAYPAAGQYEPRQRVGGAPMSASGLQGRWRAARAAGADRIHHVAVRVAGGLN